jgi:hypothetical protein
MKIYSIRLSEDGLSPNVYTNAKALFNGIEKLGDGYIPITIEVYDRKANEGKGVHLELKYNYANVVKAIKISNEADSRYASFDVACQGGTRLNITEHRILSK